jgi:hypothetical protein
MQIYTPVSDIYSLTSSLFLIQLIRRNFQHLNCVMDGSVDGYAVKCMTERSMTVIVHSG